MTHLVKIFSLYFNKKMYKLYSGSACFRSCAFLLQLCQMLAQSVRAKVGEQAWVDRAFMLIEENLT